MPCDDRSRDWSEAAQTQEHQQLLASAKSWERPERILPSVLEGAWPCWHPGSTVGAYFCGLNHQDGGASLVLPWETRAVCARILTKGRVGISLGPQGWLWDFWDLIANTCICGRISSEPNTGCHIPSSWEVVGKAMQSSHPLPTGRA